MKETTQREQITLEEFQMFLSELQVNLSNSNLDLLDLFQVPSMETQTFLMENRY